MIGKILTISALTAMLLFSGCDNDAEDRVSTQKMLDSGDFDGVIESLEEKEYRTADDNLKLASAYMDKSNYSLVDLISIISDTKDDSENSFNSFLVGISEDKKEDSLVDLEKAIYYYGEIISADAKISKYRAVSENTNLETIKLFLGLASLTRTAVVLDYLGDVTKLEDSGLDGDLLASSCAMRKVYSNNIQGCASVEYTGSLDIDGYSYEKMDVVLFGGNGIVYHYLANDKKDEMILTNYKTHYDSTLYPMPVKNETLTVSNELIDSLNDAFTYIIDAAPDDLKDDIKDYRDEIDRDRNTVISVTEFTDYIGEQMIKNQRGD